MKNLLRRKKRAKAKIKKRLNSFRRMIVGCRHESDLWLKRQWERLGLHPKDPRTPDQFNKVLPPFIPDLVNTWFKYVVECDGSIHNNLKILKKDARKTSHLIGRGYHVFRVKHGDVAGLMKIGEAIIKLREKRGQPPADITIGE